MLIHDLVKIKYVNQGYFSKNYPYHLISDDEMFNAFIDLGTGYTSSLINPKVKYFDLNYPNPFGPDDYYEKKNSKGEIIDRVSLSGEYDKLKSYIIDTINQYLKLKQATDAVLPDWIYTYMLGEVIYQNSDYQDIYDMLALLGCSNLDNEFTKDACLNCYITSLNYVSTLTTGLRPPTVFGEPHVIKNLRLGA